MSKYQTIKNAILIIWATFAVSVLVAIVDRQMGAISSSDFAGSLFTYALLCVVPYKLQQGKNWARYVYAIVVVLTTAMLLAGEISGISKITIAMSVLMIPLEVWIIYVLFSRVGNEFFLGANAT